MRAPKRLAAAGVGAVATLAVMMLDPVEHRPTSAAAERRVEVKGSAATRPSGGGREANQPACDGDGVTVGYATAFSSPGRQHLVTSVAIGDLAPTCVGAELTVSLFAGTQEFAGRPISVSGSNQTVVIPLQPSAPGVTSVSVQLVGGKPAQPAQSCARGAIRGCEPS